MALWFRRFGTVPHSLTEREWGVQTLCQRHGWAERTFVISVDADPWSVARTPPICPRCDLEAADGSDGRPPHDALIKLAQIAGKVVLGQLLRGFEQLGIERTSPGDRVFVGALPEPTLLVERE